MLRVVIPLADGSGGVDHGLAGRVDGVLDLFESGRHVDRLDEVGVQDEQRARLLN